MSTALKGEWIAAVGVENLHLTFQGNGAYTLDNSPGEYRVQAGVLILTDNSGNPKSFQVAFTGGDSITISGGDLGQPMKFFRAPSRFLLKSIVFKPTTGSILAKLINIGIILLVVIAVKVILAFAKYLSRLIIETKTGIFAYVFSKDANR